MRGRHTYLLPLALLALPACGAKTGGEEAASTPTEADVGSIRSTYDSCRDKAGGDGNRLLQCADRAVDSLATMDPGTASATADEFRALGEELTKFEGGQALSARLVAADSLVRYGIERAEIPSCQEDATSNACASARALLRDRFVQEAAAPDESVTAEPAVTPVLGGYVPPTCATVRNPALDVDSALGQYESEFPAALKDEKLVETVTLDDRQVTALAAYLACLAAKTGYGPDVIESSLWLFSSKKQGARFRAALETLAKSDSTDAAAFREFGAQVDDYLADDR